MKPRLPLDLMAEALINYYPKGMTHVALRGSHSRNAYQDILEMDVDYEGQISVTISRPGLYDTLPEALFHPIDRFDKIPANEYKERFAEECEKQQKEEENARRFFEPFDTFLFHVNCVIDHEKQLNLSDAHILSNIVCDKENDNILGNRFIAKVLPFVAECRRMRGDRTLITLMLRQILNEEGISLQETHPQETFTDHSPRYNCALDSEDRDLFLGNEFPERVTTYTLRFWNEDVCDERFPQLLTELEEFQQFVNRYFVGLEDRIVLNISTDQDEVTLQETNYNYLNHNANL
ncbi:MAG: hypothetical protein LIO91_00845 [Bacteroidales bacterium]|nr:hypothetical protein [Bacteroidales bacterium]